MEEKKGSAASIDDYINQFPEDVQAILQSVRKVIGDAAPGATEKISYGMPGFAQNGMLVWFAGHTHHIGFYPTGEGVETFKNELSTYKTSKGAVQFPLDQPIPYDLIRKIVKHRVEENTKKKGKK